MGHDIISYKIEEISYLRYNAFDEAKKELYECLNALEFYAGCSGSNDGRIFDKDELNEAKSKAKSAEVINFLNDCIEEAGQNGIYILFS